MAKTTYQIMVIMVVSLAFGVLNNVANPNKIPWVGEIRNASNVETVVVKPNNTKEAESLFPQFDPNNVQIHEISFENAVRIYESGQAVFLDARFPAEYEDGHILGAINLPADLFDEYYLATSENFSEEDPIVIYCSGPECEFARILADILRDMGCQKLMLFEDGYPAWKEAGHPVEEQD